MRRRQKKETDVAGNNDALTLLRLQQHVLKLTAAKTALEDVQQLVHETALYTFTSAQDRRTLSTAQKCLDSLRIRIEAQANTVEEAVKQNQMSLALHLRQETAEAPLLLAESLTRRSHIFPFKQARHRALPRLGRQRTFPRTHQASKPKAHCPLSWLTCHYARYHTLPGH